MTSQRSHCLQCGLSLVGGLPKPCNSGQKNKKSIHLYEGNPINLNYPLVQCLGKTQVISIYRFEFESQATTRHWQLGLSWCDI